MVRTLQTLKLASLQDVARLLMGDTSAAHALTGVGGRPLALSHIVLRHDVAAR
jgi:hypothetical protein